jgi:phosphatidylserine/phosphatidylglycerophosphate/cardiolipin synthase-like enzyme
MNKRYPDIFWDKMPKIVDEYKSAFSGSPKVEPFHPPKPKYEDCYFPDQPPKDMTSVLYPVQSFTVKIIEGQPTTIVDIGAAMKKGDSPFGGILKCFWDPKNELLYRKGLNLNEPWQFLAYFNYGCTDLAQLNWLMCLAHGVDKKKNVDPSGGRYYSYSGGEVLYFPVGLKGKTAHTHQKIPVVFRDPWFVPYLPVSSATNSEIFIDGKDYTEKLYADLNAAEKEICMTGLHFSGHFNLQRNSQLGKQSRDPNDPAALQTILAKKSEKVKIFIVVNQFWPDEPQLIFEHRRNLRNLKEFSIGKEFYKPPPFNSFIYKARGTILQEGGLLDYLRYTSQFFGYLLNDKKANRDNIHVYTDIHQGYVFHSNHQKTVIIDQKIAYFGGIDLTDIDGDRWDTVKHSINNPDRKFDKPERNWHDIHMRVQKPEGTTESNPVDYVYANFLARYYYGYLYKTKPIVDNTGPVPAPDPVDRAKLVNCAFGSDATKNYVKIDKRVYPWERRIRKLAMPVVQIVRSMPSGENNNYKDNQLPEWNKGKVKAFENSAFDAYLAGIRAAERYIYLENQWIADLEIWKALEKKAQEKAGDNDFFMILVLPKKFLAAAGYGHDQAMEHTHWYLPGKGLYESVEQIFTIFKEARHPNHFGVFSVLQPYACLNGNSKKKHWEIPECAWDYMYVHSKILVVDDKWLLVGSANAGGISLKGLGFESEPDTELSGIVFDDRPDSEVKKFRKKLWREHLNVDDSDIDDYKKGAALFIAQANDHAYNTEHEARVHYNCIFFPYREPRIQSVWPHLNWKTISQQLDDRIKNPDKIHQTYYKLSVPLTCAHMMISRNPERYKSLVNDLFQSGKSLTCGVNSNNQTKDLLNSRIDPLFPILEIDWLVGSSILDKWNSVIDYQGTVKENVAASLSDSSICTLMERIIPCIGGVEMLSCWMYGEFSAAEEASRILDNARPNTVFIAVEIATSMLVRMNELEIKAAGDDVDLRNTMCWTVKCNHPFLAIRPERSYPAYPGVLTPFDIANIIPNKMLVRLLGLRCKYSGSQVSKVQMEFWTWGEKCTIELDKKEFEKGVYAFFIGYDTPEARKAAANKLVTKSQTPLKLPANASREFVHSKVHQENAKVTCVTGRIRVEIASRVWYKWDWKSDSSQTLHRGQSHELSFAKISRLRQDNLVRITADGIDSDYLIEFSA